VGGASLPNPYTTCDVGRVLGRKQSPSRSEAKAGSIGKLAQVALIGETKAGVLSDMRPGESHIERHASRRIQRTTNFTDDRFTGVERPIRVSTDAKGNLPPVYCLSTERYGPSDNANYNQQSSERRYAHGTLG